MSDFKLSPGVATVHAKCVNCGSDKAVTAIFTDGPTSRYRTWRYVDYLRPVNRGKRCLDCGVTNEVKTTMERKPREVVEIRQDRVVGIKRLKAAGWTLFEGDKRW